MNVAELYDFLITDHLPQVFAGEKPVPLMLFGPPGVGKSQAVREATKALSGGFIDSRVSLYDPVDLRGLMMIQDGKTTWQAPDFLPDADIHPYGTHFLDEINLAPIAVQNAAYQYIHDRRIGDYRLPDRWGIIAAGNRAEDRAATFRMSEALVNRFRVYQITPDLETSKQYFLSRFSGREITGQVVGFLNFRPELLLKPAGKPDTPFPTPRSWETVIRHRHVRSGAMLEHLAASLGDACAGEFLAFLEIYREIPDASAILDQGVAFIPANASVAWACLGMVLNELMARPGPERVVNWLLFATSLEADFQVAAIKEALSVKSLAALLVQCRGFQDWLKQNSAFINTL